jgi:tetratricopeptide (TPR) repeat protein
LTEDLFKKALELNPKKDMAYVGVGWLHYKQRQDAQAEDLFRKALELNPKNDGAYLGLGFLYLRQGNFSQAEDLFRKSLEFNPKNDMAYAGLVFLYNVQGNHKLAEEYLKKAKELRMRYYLPSTVNNYRRVKEILDKRGIRLVCVQHPRRSVESLKKIFEDQHGIIFVDNEKIFEEAIEKDGYKEYFIDIFGEDFGHCTPKSNRLLAENIANVILKGVFDK